MRRLGKFCPRCEGRDFLKPSAIADAFWYVAHQDRGVWTHELDVRPFQGKVLARARYRMSHDLTLFGVGTSRTIRAHWMLQELGLEYESHPIQSRTGETVTDEFRRLNPRHKIPVLQHKSFVLSESAAILHYLSEAFPDLEKIYAPYRTQPRAALNEWCYFIM